MSPTKLKLGILLDSYEIPAWIHSSLDRIAGSGSAEFSLLVLNGVNRASKDVSKSNNIIYRWFNAVDEKVFVREKNALEPVNAEGLFSNAPVIAVIPNKQGGADHFSSQDVEQIREYGLDILIKVGFENLGGDMLAVAKYGVWSYTFDGNPHGF